MSVLGSIPESPPQYGGSRFSGAGAGGGGGGGGGGTIGVLNPRDLISRSSEDLANLYGRFRSNTTNDSQASSELFRSYGGTDMSMPLLDRQTEGEIQAWPQEQQARGEGVAKEKDGGGILSGRSNELLGFSETEKKNLEGEATAIVVGTSNANNNNNTSNNNSMNSSMMMNSTTCQDCGNQAKKDCTYFRCRTCCKSRGFDCATHIKSTWVPAAKRREKQIQEAVAIASGQPRPRTKRSRMLTGGGGGGGGSHTSTSAATNTPPRSSDINSTHQVTYQDLNFGSSFPEELKAQGVYRRVGISSGGGAEEIGYHTSIIIGGHVFKGVLTDHGVETTATQHHHSPLPELHLGGRINSAAAPPSLLDPCSSTSPLLPAAAATTTTTATASHHQQQQHHHQQHQQGGFGGNLMGMGGMYARHE